MSSSRLMPGPGWFSPMICPKLGCFTLNQPGLETCSPSSLGKALTCTGAANQVY
jgi:hypothetical protein